jgi:hypothetical protein
MSIENDITRFNEIDIGRVIRDLSDKRYFKQPTTLEAQSRLLDEVREDMPALFEIPEQLMRVLEDDQSQGWNASQIQLLGTGVDMALLILHELLSQESD